MKIDLTISISVLLALSSIFSNIIIAIINNFHQTKMKKMELKQAYTKNEILHRRAIFEDYLAKTGRLVHRPSAETLEEYGKVCYLACLFAPPEVRALIEQIDSAVQREDYSLASKTLGYVAISLSVEVPPLSQ